MEKSQGLTFLFDAIRNSSADCWVVKEDAPAAGTCLREILLTGALPVTTNLPI